MNLKSLKNIKVPTKSDLINRMERFEKEYENQYPKILKKISISKGEKKKRILEFKKDVDNMKKMSDKLKSMLYSKGIKGKLIKTKFIMFESKKFLFAMIKILNKYKKEDCDIDNFEV